jgi:hypothetical protein
MLSPFTWLLAVDGSNSAFDLLIQAAMFLWLYSTMQPEGCQPLPRSILIATLVWRTIRDCANLPPGPLKAGKQEVPFRPGVHGSDALSCI